MYFIDDTTPKSSSFMANINTNKNTSNNNQIQIGEVISVDDKNYLGRIKVRIKGSPSTGGDDTISDANLPWSFPLLPKFLSTQPKKGEAVFIFVFSNDLKHSDRMYVGPIISQPHLLEKDPFYYTAKAGFTFGTLNPNISVDTLPELKGIFPNPQDISIQGRYNTDITQKNNEIVLRAGKFTSITPTGNNPYPFTYNKATQAFIQIKNDVVFNKQVEWANVPTQEKGSVTNIVASKINLLTHKDGTPRFDLTNQDNLISDDELAKILDEAHQLPFGDILLQYLKLLKDVMLNHVHNGSGNPATDLTSGDKQTVAIFKSKAEDLEKAMLSKNIRIN